MREPREVGERGAALVVHEHERELLGRVAGGQAGDQRAQQLALARAGRADEHAVRAHAALGRLLEVELEHVALRRAGDRRAQALRARPPAPLALEAAEQAAEPHRGAQPALSVPALGQPQRRQRARHRLARAEIGLVEEHLGDRRRVLTPQLPHPRTARGHGQPRVDVRRLELARVGQQDQHRPQLARPCEQLAEGGHLVGGMVGRVAVEHHDQLRRHERHLPPADVGLGDPPQLLEPRPQLGLQQRVEVGHRAREQELARHVRVQPLVRQPLPPLPCPRVGRVEGGQQPHVVRRAPGRELRHQRPCPRTRALAIAGDGEHADLLEVDHHRLAAQRRAPLDHLASLLERVRLVLGERVHAEVERDVAVERDRPGAEAHVQEVLVVGPALPDVGALDQQRPQPAHVGVQPRHRAALELARLRQLAVALAQVLGVPSRLLGRPLAHAAALRPAHAERERQQEQQHRPGDVQEHAVPVDDREADHADPADDGKQQLDDRRVGRNRLRRRRRDAQRVRRNGRRILPRRSMEGQGVLCRHLVISHTTDGQHSCRGVHFRCVG